MDIIQILQDLGKLTVKDKDILAKVDEWKAQTMASINYLSDFSGTLKRENDELVSLNNKLKEEQETIKKQIADEKSLLSIQGLELDKKIAENNILLSEISNREQSILKREQDIEASLSNISAQERAIVDRGVELNNQFLILQDKIKHADILKNQYTELVNSLDDKENRLNTKEKEIAVKLQELDYKNDRYGEKMAYISKKEAENTAKENQNAETLASIILQQSSLKTSQSELAEREKIIVKIEADLQLKEKSIMQREDEIKEALKSIELRELEIRRDRADIIEERNRQNVIIKEKNLSINN